MISVKEACEISRKQREKNVQEMVNVVGMATYLENKIRQTAERGETFFRDREILIRWFEKLSEHRKLTATTGLSGITVDEVHQAIKDILGEGYEVEVNLDAIDRKSILAVSWTREYENL